MRACFIEYYYCVSPELNPACDYILLKKHHISTFFHMLSSAGPYSPPRFVRLSPVLVRPSISIWEITWLKQLPTFLKWSDEKINWEGNSVVAIAFQTPGRPPGFQPPNRTSSGFLNFFFGLLRCLPKLLFPIGPPFLIAFHISSFQSYPSPCLAPISFMSPFFLSPRTLGPAFL